MKGSSLVAITLCLIVAIFTPGSFSRVASKPHTFLKTVSVGFDVNVILLGFNGDGGFGYSLGEETLERLLVESMPSYQPSSLAAKRQLAVNYLINYHVSKLPKSHLDEFSQRLGEALRNVDRNTKGGDKKYLIRANDLDWESYFNSLVQAAKKDSSMRGEYTVIFINADKREIQAVRDNSSPPQNEPDWQYYYTYGSDSPMTSWVSRDRYVVIDISAGPVTFGPSDAGEGAVSNVTFPQLSKFNAKLAKAAQSGGIRKHQPMTISNFVEIEAHLSTLIMSAIRHVFVPDIHVTPVDADKVLLPIIVLRNNDRYDPWSADNSLHIDFAHIKEEVSKMALPHQELIILQDIHGLHEHKHISLAVAKSRRADTVHELNVLGKYIVQEKPYLDSSTLLQGMKDAQDILTAGYLKGTDKIHHAESFFSDTLPPAIPDLDPTTPDSGSPRPQGTRILPVYVLSLLGMEKELLLDHSTLWAATQEAVIVLQTDTASVPVPFFNGRDRIHLHPRNSTRHIIAGIAAALGGLNGATKCYSPIHKKELTSFTWAHGHQPWGVFGGADGLSQIHRDMILRNSVISRLDVAIDTIGKATSMIDAFVEEYMSDPFGVEREAFDWEEGSEENELGITAAVVEGLYREMGRLDANFNSITQKMRYYQLEEAYTQSASIALSALAFAEYVKAQLRAAETELECCIKKHTPTHHNLLAENLFIIVGICIMSGAGYAITHKNKKRR